MSLQLGVHGMPPAKRRVILRELATARGVTQRGLAKTLQKLHDRGLLTDALVRTPTPQQYERAIHAAVEDISEKVTPVGPVVQYISLPIDDGMAWPYIHPAAFLIYLTSVCASFYNLIADVVAHVGHDLNVLVYIDAVNPGNQLAPTANRDCECNTGHLRSCLRGSCGANALGSLSGCSALSWQRRYLVTYRRS